MHVVIQPVIPRAGKKCAGAAGLPRWSAASFPARRQEGPSAAERPFPELPRKRV